MVGDQRRQIYRHKTKTELDSRNGIVENKQDVDCQWENKTATKDNTSHLHTHARIQRGVYKNKVVKKLSILSLDIIVVKSLFNLL